MPTIWRWTDHGEGQREVEAGVTIPGKVDRERVCVCVRERERERERERAGTGPQVHRFKLTLVRVRGGDGGGKGGGGRECKTVKWNAAGTRADHKQRRSIGASAPARLCLRASHYKRPECPKNRESENTSELLGSSTPRLGGKVGEGFVLPAWVCQSADPLARNDDVTKKRCCGRT